MTLGIGGEEDGNKVALPGLAVQITSWKIVLDI